MKIAVTGKGGAGKSTFAGILAHFAVNDGKNVLAVDSDPDANLAFALGIPEDERNTIIPIAERTELIEERTGAKLKEFGQIFKLNPQVSDVADKYSYNYKGIHLLVMGAVEAGGTGCACPENVFLRNLLSNIILKREDFVIADMEAGIEHLGRATAKGVDMMIAVTEPTPQSIETSLSIDKLAKQIGIEKVYFIGSKIANPDEKDYLFSRFDNERIIGLLPYSESIRTAERDGKPIFDNLDDNYRQIFRDIYVKICKIVNNKFN